MAPIFAGQYLRTKIQLVHCCCFCFDPPPVSFGIPKPIFGNGQHAGSLIARNPFSARIHEYNLIRLRAWNSLFLFTFSRKIIGIKRQFPSLPSLLPVFLLLLIKNQSWDKKLDDRKGSSIYVASVLSNPRLAADSVFLVLLSCSEGPGARISTLLSGS